MHDRHEYSPSPYGMALAGAVAGFLAARVLPPILAQAGGRLAPSDPFDRLAQDHRVILDFIDRMEWATGTAQRSGLLLRLKRRLSTHALAEEDIIYPILREEIGDKDAAAQLYAEHGDIKTHLYVLESILTGDHADQDWAARVRALRDLVAQHARQEEDVEFPRLRRMMKDDDITVMAGKMQREKALLL